MCKKYSNQPVPATLGSFGSMFDNDVDYHKVATWNPFPHFINS